MMKVLLLTTRPFHSFDPFSNHQTKSSINLNKKTKIVDDGEESDDEQEIKETDEFFESAFDLFED